MGGTSSTEEPAPEAAKEEPPKEPEPAPAPAAPAPKPEDAKPDEDKKNKKDDGGKSPAKGGKEKGKGKKGDSPKGKGESKGKSPEKGKGKTEKGKVSEKGKTEKGKTDKGKGKGGEKSDGKGKGKTELYSGPMGGGDGFRLNVKNLGEDMTSEQLTELFKDFGTVSSAAVKKRDDGKSRGFGYVILSTEEEGKKAIEEMNGKEVNGKKLEVSPAERRAVEADAKGKGKKGKGKNGNNQYEFLQQQQYMYWMQQQQAAYMQSVNSNGKPGTQMSYIQTPYGMMPHHGAQNIEYEGSIKSLYKNAHGFIVCQDTHRLYQRDVYLGKDVMPEGAKIADRIKFTVGFNDSGHPKALTAELVSLTAAPTPAAEEKK